jgi:ABC-type antimicrobial peptide transport system permease subunit
LGATRSSMVWLVLREAFVLAAGGIAMGLPVVLALGRVAKAALYGIEPFDPVALASAALLLLVFTALAATWPGLRASSLHPTTALRRE